MRNARNLAKKISQSQCTSAVTEQPAGWPGSFTIAVMNVLIADAVVAGAADLGGDRREALGGGGDRGGGAGGGLPHGVIGLDLLVDPSRDGALKEAAVPKALESDTAWPEAHESAESASE